MLFVPPWFDARNAKGIRRFTSALSMLCIPLDPTILQSQLVLLVLNHSCYAERNHIIEFMRSSPYPRYEDSSLLAIHDDYSVIKRDRHIVLYNDIP
jgi:hypothetical protein|uniref:Uncharacterized protein n=1 Tax=Picea glauca TaxID=3330 RepID=A0A101M5I8_PICGL|nr:hypothetical protein ABT39_MTgene1119 [Picea glauca]QHR87764.1 hypothetical protein Q903MT_gene1776 [Picea sitchensis]